MSVTLQIEMESELKEKAEELYNKIGISLAEAIRLFALKSVEEGKMPFTIDKDIESTKCISSKYANVNKISLENGTYEGTAIKLLEDNSISDNTLLDVSKKIIDDNREAYEVLAK